VVASAACELARIGSDRASFVLRSSPVKHWFVLLKVLYDLSWRQLFWNSRRVHHRQEDQPIDCISSNEAAEAGRDALLEKYSADDGIGTGGGSDRHRHVAGNIPDQVGPIDEVCFRGICV